MRSQFSPVLPLVGLLAMGIAPQLRGEMPQGRRPAPMPRPSTGASTFTPGGIGNDRPMGVDRTNSGRPMVPPGRAPLPRPSYRRLSGTVGFAYLPSFQRCTILPTSFYWRDREYDIMAAIQRQARSGYIPVTPYPVDQNSVTGTSMVASGWRAYGFLVPPGGQVTLKLEHPKPAWFRVYWVDQWGEYKPGMMVKPGEPEALYINRSKDMKAVYAIVDDPGQWATSTSPYTLTAARTFDATKLEAPAGVSIHQGIWNTAPESYWLSPEHR